MRRARRRAAYRRRAGHSRQGAHAAQGRHRAVGEIEFALLHADARGARQALQVHARHQMEGPAEKDAGSDPLRLGRHRDPLFLRRRRARLRDQAAVRRHHHQSRAPLPARPISTGRARRSPAISPTCRARRATAIASSPKRSASRSASGISAKSPICRSKAAAAWFDELPDKLNAKQNEIAVRILKEIRARLKFLIDVGLDYLTLARASRHAVRRREPAHPARLADRLRPDRRALRARRALDRAASARQRAAPRHAQAAARPRQHRDRRRARRGRDPRRRLCGRYRPRRRRARRPDRRRRHARRHHGQSEFADRRISQRRARDRGARAPARRTRPAC